LPGLLVLATGDAIAEGGPSAGSIVERGHFAIPADDLEALEELYESGEISGEMFMAMGEPEPEAPPEAEIGAAPLFIIGGLSDCASDIEERRRQNAVVRLVSRSETICTGVLLTSSWVLTSVHCMDEGVTGIQVGCASLHDYGLSKQSADCRAPHALHDVTDDLDDELDCSGDELGEIPCACFADDPKGIPCYCLDDADFENATAKDDFALVKLEDPVSSDQATSAFLAGPTDSWPPTASPLPTVRLSAFGSTKLAEDEADDCGDADFPATSRLYGHFQAALHSRKPEKILLNSTQAYAATGDSGAPIFALEDSPWAKQVVIGIQKHSDCHGYQYAASTLRSEISTWIESVTDTKSIPFVAPTPEVDTP